ncbi:uncharacterized protein Bfra_011777 [Botrytis fragariae]|uniref:Uncharacterized protein n=1 Tax=Botrytis fragariae TaxID=1964551 RepID=A0A8H6EEC9_9HELO|nr:uncharacterized protein Bfra_011777 [Botrytis fragariae]KAF5869234.1 hypothetical protein Bfra_011777 [Botrytis fragariae]
MKDLRQVPEFGRSVPSTKPDSSRYPSHNSHTSQGTEETRALPSFPSHQPHRSNFSSISSSNNFTENKDHPRKRLSRAKAKIKELGNFGPNLVALERRTQKLFMDQANLNFNLLSRLKMPLTSSSPQGCPSRLGPLQHPHTNLQNPSNSGQSLVTHTIQVNSENVEMNDAPDIPKSIMVPVESERQNRGEVRTPRPIIRPSQAAEPVQITSNSSQLMTPSRILESPRHTALQTTTTNIRDQIELEISHLMLTKHNELRLIETELAKAQIMLEQLRRVHLRPFNLVKNEEGQVYAVRVVVRSFSGEERRQRATTKRQREDERAAEELKIEEMKKGGSGMGLRNRYVKR